jgi:hypothetical protein
VDLLDETLKRLGFPPTACACLVQAVRETPDSYFAIQQLKNRVCEHGMDISGDAFERRLLSYAALQTAPRIENLRVYEPVKSLIRIEFQHYTKPPERATDSLAIGTNEFVVACKTISLVRFPAGPMDWEISGFPRSWLLSIRKSDLPRVLAFLLFRVRGFAPMFFIHIARQPKNRSLVIEREVLRAYYRIARSLELHPQVRGILANAWFHDPAAVGRYPHLSWINHPYLEANGLITTAGPAPANSGFMERNEDRKKQFEKGELAFRMGIAIWPREAAMQWAAKHPELST